MPSFKNLERTSKVLWFSIEQRDRVWAATKIWSTSIMAARFVDLSGDRQNKSSEHQESDNHSVAKSCRNVEITVSPKDIDCSLDRRGRLVEDLDVVLSKLLTETLRLSASSKDCRLSSPATLVRLSIRFRVSRHISEPRLVALGRVTRSHRSPVSRSGSAMAALLSSKTRTSKIFQERASRCGANASVKTALVRDISCFGPICRSKQWLICLQDS